MDNMSIMEIMDHLKKNINKEMADYAANVILSMKHDDILKIIPSPHCDHHNQTPHN